MSRNMRRWTVVVAALALAGLATGCGKKSSEKKDLELQVRTLQAEVETLRAQQMRMPTTGGAISSGGYGGLAATEIAGGVRLDAPGDLLFEAGRATLKESAKKQLALAAAAIRKNHPGWNIRVDGHTDSDKPKIVKKIYPTNWDLAAARALTVLKFLIAEGKIPERDCSLGAWAEYKPVASNATGAGKKTNRRVEIFVLAPGTVSRSGIELPPEPPAIEEGPAAPASASERPEVGGATYK